MKSNQDDQKICYILHFVYLFLIFSFSVIQVVLSALQVSEVFTYSEAYEILLTNWKKEYIIDFTYVASSNECPPSYSENFINYQWPGTKVAVVFHGCLCSESGEILPRQCCVDEKCNDDDQCIGKDIVNMDPKTFSSWNVGNSQINNYKICVKRLKGYSFFDKAPREQSCQENEIACGISQASIDYIFCVPIGQPCPIRMIKMENSLALTNQYTEGVAMPNGQYLMISRTSGNYPISESYISEGTSICNDPQIKIPSPNRTPYILLNNYEQCKVVDTRWKSIVSVDELTFYSINNMIYLQQILPRYDISSNYNYNLQTRTFIPITLSCRKYINQFQENQDIISTYANSLTATLVFTSIFLVYNIFYEILLMHKYYSQVKPADQTFYQYTFEHEKPQKKNTTYNYSSKKDTKDIKDGEQEQDCCLQWPPPFHILMKIAFALKILFIIVEGIALNFAFDISFTERNFISDLIQKNCVDGFTIDILKSLDNRFNSRMMDAIFAFWLLYLLLEPTIIYAIYWRVFEYMKIKKVFGIVHSELPGVTNGQKNIDNNNNVSAEQHDQGVKYAQQGIQEKQLNGVTKSQNNLGKTTQDDQAAKVTESSFLIKQEQHQQQQQQQQHLQQQQILQQQQQNNNNFSDSNVVRIKNQLNQSIMPINQPDSQQDSFFIPNNNNSSGMK